MWNFLLKQFSIYKKLFFGKYVNYNIKFYFCNTMQLTFQEKTTLPSYRSETSKHDC
jgi:hypothetical protein